MKTILLATDFSENSDSASSQVTQLSAILNTRLVLVDVYQHSMNLLSFESSLTQTEKNKVSSLCKLYRLRNRLQKAHSGRLAISVIAKKGSGLETINAEKQIKADLLIIMPKPHNKLVYSVLETTSQKIARQSQIPVLAMI